jgi:hypothetical protein
VDDYEIGPLFIVAWTWGTEARMFLASDVKGKREAENQVRTFVGEGGTIVATEVEWGATRRDADGMVRTNSCLAELM